MTLVVAWLVLPLLLGALCLGAGLLLERLSGTSLPTPLLLPAGLAAIVTVSSLVVSLPATAPLTTPLVAALTVAGFVVGRLRQPDWYALAAAVTTYVCYGAPVLASGEATFTGYVKLDDTATFLAFTDRVLEHGRSLDGLEPSTYEAILDLTIAHGYPLGSVLPLAIGQELVRLDPAWLYQPWLAFCAGALALCLYSLAAPLVPTRPLRALVACVAAQPALLYGFAAWGGVKELAAAALVAAVAALTVAVRPPYRARALLPLAVASAAVLDTLSLAGLLWLLPPVAAVAVLVRRQPGVLAAGLVGGLALAAPALATATEFLRGSNRDVLADEDELGNLVAALHPLQIAGVWPSGDFRVDPESGLLTALLVALVVGAALAGVAVAVILRARALLLALAAAVLGAVAFAVVGAPWVAAKAYAMGSPVVLLAALCGCAALATNQLGLARGAARAALVAGTVAGVSTLAGVAWSNALAYHDVNLAPRAQLAELEDIGERFARGGPALMTEYQPYGVRHFLRELDAEGSSELRRRPVLLRDGRLAGKAEYVDLDQIRLSDLLVYRTLVLRRSPTLSRPPAAYRLVWRGRWYDVWQRGEADMPADHLPLGDTLEPSAVPSCDTVGALDAVGPLVAPPREPNVVASLDAGELPAGWQRLGGGAVLPTRSGTATVPVEVATAGRYRLWLGGSVRGTVRASVDGARIGSISSQLQHAGQWLPLGVVDLAAGPHDVSLEVSLPSTSSGAGGGGFPLGPLALEPVGDDGAHVEAAVADELCKRRLDWVEALVR
jgi:hypothetical protein